MPFTAVALRRLSAHLHCLTLVHGLDGGDSELPAGKRDERTACRQITAVLAGLAGVISRRSRWLDGNTPYVCVCIVHTYIHITYIVKYTWRPLNKHCG